MLKTFGKKEEDEFTRIARAAANEREKKAASEARILSLQEEQSRIYKTVSADIEEEVSTQEAVEEKSNKLLEEISSGIERVKAIFDKEGVSY